MRRISKALLSTERIAHTSASEIAAAKFENTLLVNVALQSAAEGFLANPSAQSFETFRPAPVHFKTSVIFTKENEPPSEAIFYQNTGTAAPFERHARHGGGAPGHDSIEL
jgi:hypothetical protein